jgi:hypothetical protein
MLTVVLIALFMVAPFAVGPQKQSTRDPWGVWGRRTCAVTYPNGHQITYVTTVLQCPVPGRTLDVCPNRKIFRPTFRSEADFETFVMGCLRHD